MERKLHKHLIIVIISAHLKSSSCSYQDEIFAVLFIFIEFYADDIIVKSSSSFWSSDKMFTSLAQRAKVPSWWRNTEKI